MSNNPIIKELKFGFAKENYFSGNQILLLQTVLNKKFENNEKLILINHKKLINNSLLLKDKFKCFVDFNENNDINLLNNFIKFGVLSINNVKYKCGLELYYQSEIENIILTERAFTVFKSISPELFLDN